MKLDADGKPEEALRFSIILNYLMRNFDSSNFMGQALKTTRTLRATDLASFPKHKLYVTWAMCCIASPPAEKERLKILNEARAAPRRRTRITTCVVVVALIEFE